MTNGELFIRKLYGHWWAIALPIVYFIIDIYSYITEEVLYPWYTDLHVLGLLSLSILFKTTSPENERANKIGIYLFYILTFTVWFAYD